MLGKLSANLLVFRNVVVAHITARRSDDCGRLKKLFPEIYSYFGMSYCNS